MVVRVAQTGIKPDRRIIWRLDLQIAARRPVLSHGPLAKRTYERCGHPGPAGARIDVDRGQPEPITIDRAPSYAEYLASPAQGREADPVVPSQDRTAEIGQLRFAAIVVAGQPIRRGDGRDLDRFGRRRHGG